VPDWAYFTNDADANEWLEFDCHEEEAERYAIMAPDQFEEWRRRRDGTWA
jgi:hypothetical protein